MNRLIKALAAGRQRKRFTCPATQLELEMRQPVYADRFAAELEARRHWGEAEIKNHADLQCRADLTRALLIGRCLFVVGDDAPLGDAILEVGENAIESYDAVLRSIESPPAEEWSQTDVDGMIELIKKNDPAVAAFLKISAGSTVYGLLRSMVARLSNSPMSDSCSSSTTGNSATSSTATSTLPSTTSTSP